VAFDKIRQVIKIDITSGDVITPKELEFEYKLMFEDRRIKIKAYNLETIIVEKFETVISRGTTNSRMRDYYDLYMLVKLFWLDIDRIQLMCVISNTSKMRGTLNSILECIRILAWIEDSEYILDL